MRILYIILGSVSLGLGILGIFLPLLPTTPFLLLTAALYCKSSPRLYNWLLNHKHLGPYIRNFREHKAIPLRAKIFSVSLMWIMMLSCILFIVHQWWVKILLLIIAVGVTYHILSFRTLKKEELEQQHNNRKKR
ncbi:MAG: YbaN family protein [Bacteroides sp.]|nr:YbaN family protein [Bacteroides sp.]